MILIRRLLSALIIFIFTTSAASAEPIKIGALIPLTGGYAPYGQLVLRGLQISLGDSVEWVIEDIGSMDAKSSIAGAHKLLEIDKVPLVVGFGIDDTEWVAPLFNRAKVPFVVAWDSNKRIESLGSFIFGAGFETTSGGKKGAEFLASSGQVKKVAIIAEESTYIHTAVNAFRKQLAKDGISIVTEDWYNIGNLDFRSTLTKARLKKADYLYLMPALLESYEAMLKQRRELEINIPFITNEFVVPDPETSKNRKSLEGCGNWFPDDGRAELEAKYQARFKEAPWNYGPLIVGSQAGDLIRPALTKKASAASISQHLNKALGPNRRAKKSFAIWCWDDGVFKRKL